MKIKVLFLDVDGTLTDGKIYMGNNGEMMKAFDIKDGYALHTMLPLINVLPVIITGRKSIILEERCRELGIVEIHQGCCQKRDKMYEIANRLDLTIESDGRIEASAYIGDDVLDIPAMKICKLAGCPNDAVDEVKNIVSYVCKRNGGRGAVREFIEWLNVD